MFEFNSMRSGYGSFSRKSAAATRREKQGQDKLNAIISSAATRDQISKPGPHIFELLSPDIHLVDASWKDLRQWVARTHPDWSLKRRVATEDEKRQAGEKRKGKTYFVIAVHKGSKSKKSKKSKKCQTSTLTASFTSANAPSPSSSQCFHPSLVSTSILPILPILDEISGEISDKVSEEVDEVDHTTTVTLDFDASRDFGLSLGIDSGRVSITSIYPTEVDNVTPTQGYEFQHELQVDDNILQVGGYNIPQIFHKDHTMEEFFKFLQRMKSDYITRQITLPITFGRRGTSSSSSLSSSSSSSFSSPSSTLHSSSSTFSSFSSSSASHLLPSPQKIPSGNIYPNSNDVRLARNEWERRKTLEIMFPPIRMNKILTAMSAAATDHDNHNNNDMGVDTTSSTPTRETSKRKRARKKEKKKKEEEEEEEEDEQEQEKEKEEQAPSKKARTVTRTLGSNNSTRIRQWEVANCEPTYRGSMSHSAIQWERCLVLSDMTKRVCSWDVMIESDGSQVDNVPREFIREIHYTW